MYRRAGPGRFRVYSKFVSFCCCNTDFIWFGRKEHQIVGWCEDIMEYLPSAPDHWLQDPDASSINFSSAPGSGSCKTLVNMQDKICTMDQLINVYLIENGEMQKVLIGNFPALLRPKFKSQILEQ